VRSGLPFIDGWREASSCLRVPSQDLRVVSSSCLVIFVSSVNNVLGDIPYVLSLHDVPSMGLARLLVRG
jgi:hypothetical protein